MPKTANKDLKNHTYCILKERLVNCIYPPGTLLNEAQLAADLGASRTPVREAISRLEMEGFVKIMPKKGIYVTDISLNDVLQIFRQELRLSPLPYAWQRPTFPARNCWPSAASSKERPLIYRTDSDWTPPCTCSSSNTAATAISLI